MKIIQEGSPDPLIGTCEACGTIFSCKFEESYKLKTYGRRWSKTWDAANCPKCHKMTVMKLSKELQDSKNTTGNIN